MVVREGDDVTEDSNSKRQLRLCELMTTEVPPSQLTPTMLKDGQVLEKGYIWKTKHVLRGDSGPVKRNWAVNIMNWDRILPDPLCVLA